MLREINQKSWCSHYFGMPTKKNVQVVGDVDSLGGGGGGLGVLHL